MPSASSAKLAAPYYRGDFWLGRRGDSPNWYIYRYNPEKAKNDCWSTKTDDLHTASDVLTQRFLEAQGQSDVYCPTCGKKRADGLQYVALQAITDYRVGHARNKDGYAAIRSRLDHICRYIEDELDRLDLTCEEAGSEKFAVAFRAWLIQQPVIWTDAQDNITTSRQRFPSSVEESLAALRSALIYAVKQGRSDAPPRFALRSRQSITKPVWSRATVEQLADMVGYAAAAEHRITLYRFLIASICTTARPSAVFDMNVKHERFQWNKGDGVFNLNPFGRVQSKKFRPVVPVIAPLRTLLEDAELRSSGGWVVHQQGRKMSSVHSAWASMIRDLKLGEGSEWGSYLIRRTMATLLRQKGANLWDVQGYLGHRIGGTTEIYAYDRLFTTARQGLEEIMADIAVKSGLAFHYSPTTEPLDLVE